ncbi:MAG: 50S ribosomal protein L32 [Coriobacteriales bacterium]|jgi:large subunit ribosomal protein L32|nr:50S ribosomal protein L32 [Coriobacteriales bacterium]
MAVPKRKTGRSVTRSRRAANSKLTEAPRSVCPQCGAAKLPHYVCPNCGSYKGREVIVTE